jgi:hypothetical protein
LQPSSEQKANNGAAIAENNDVSMADSNDALKTAKAALRRKRSIGKRKLHEMLDDQAATDLSRQIAAAFNDVAHIADPSALHEGGGSSQEVVYRNLREESAKKFLQQPQMTGEVAPSMMSSTLSPYPSPSKPVAAKRTSSPAHSQMQSKSLVKHVVLSNVSTPTDRIRLESIIEKLGGVVEQVQ